MTPRRRLLVVLTLLALFLFLGALFWPAVHDGLVAPLALVSWVLLRLFVLSIDQRVYWLALVLALPLLLYRALLRSTEPLEESYAGRPAAARSPVIAWRGRIALALQRRPDLAPVREELLSLVVALHAARAHVEPDFQVREALRRRELDLPPEVHAFLFQHRPPGTGLVAARLARRAREMARRKLRAWTARGATAHQRAISDVLTYLEDSLDTRHGR